MKTFKEENDTLINSFLEHTFFRGWERGTPNFNGLEIDTGTVPHHPETIIANLGMLLDWLAENKYQPEIAFLSKEHFAQKLNLKALRLIVDSFKKGRVKSKIMIPTSYAFLKFKEKTKKVENLLKYSRKMNVPIHLSTLEVLGENKYPDEYFALNKRWRFKFHLTIRPPSIKEGKDNFLWLQKKLKKFGLPPWNIYLQEARDEKWKPGHFKYFMDFVDFLVEWTYRVPCRSDKNCFANALLLKGGYGILSSPFSDDRSLSSRTDVRVMLNSLTIVPGNGMSNAPFVEAKFRTKNNKIVGLESNNPEILIGRISIKETALPHCETCSLKYLCQKNRLSSQFETTGDPFSPIPTVCKLEHAKIYSLIKALKKFDLYKTIYSKLNPERQYSLEIIGELSSESQKNEGY